MRSLLVSLVCIAAASVSIAQEPDPRTEAMARLLQPVTAEIEDARLEDVIAFIEQSTGAELEARWIDESRSGVGLDRDALITLSWKDRPAIDLLQRAVERASDEFDAATWQMTEGGIVEVGPRSALNRRAFVKMYDVRDLLVVIPDFTEVPDLELGQIVQGQGGSQQDVDIEVPEGETEAQRLERLIEIIQTTVEFEQWRANGGDAAEITPYRQTLLVRAPGYVHRQLGGAAWWPTERDVRRFARR